MTRFLFAAKVLCLLVFLVAPKAPAETQGSIPGLTSTPITFSGHADDFVAGPDGNVWIVDQTSNAIGRLAADGSAYKAFPLPTTASGVNSITLGPDGNLWFTESSVAKVGRITTSGTITEFPLPAGFNFLLYGFVNGLGTITAGPDGNLWISNGPQLVKVTPSGTATVIQVTSSSGSDLLQIGKCVAGPDGNLWCLSNIRIAGIIDNHPAKVTTAGVATLYAGIFSQYFDILNAPDGNLWISSQGTSPERGLTRITPAGVETVYTLPTTRESQLAVGADGNIWFTERTTAGNLWQLVLSSATDDGQATFNSAPITTSYPEGIIAVRPPIGAAGRSEQGAAPRCPAGADFEVITSTSYGANMTRCATPIPGTCTDLFAFVSSTRRGKVAGTSTGFAGCTDQDIDKSPDAALDVTLTLKLPSDSIIDSTDANGVDINKWSCQILGSGGLTPSLECTAPSITQGKSREVNFVGAIAAGKLRAICGTSTFDTDRSNDATKSFTRDIPPKGSPPAVSIPGGRGAQSSPH